MTTSKRTHSAPMVARQTHTSSGPSRVDDLLAIALEHAKTAGSDGAALLALAALDAAAAVDCLVPTGGAETAAVSRSMLAQIVAVVVEKCAASRGLVPRPLLLELMAHYGPLMSREHVIELAAAVQEGSPDPGLTDAIHRSLARAPTAAGLLRVAAELAIADTDSAKVHSLLTRLGRADPSLPTLQFVHGARRRIARTGDPEVRIALLSSFTIDPLVPYLDLECRSLALEPELWIAPFNTWEREMLGGGSALERFAPHVAFLSAAADDLIPELAGSPSAAALSSAGGDAVDRILAAATRFTSWSTSTLVVHGLHSAFRDPLGPAAGRGEQSRGEIMAELNARLAAGLRSLPRTYLVDLSDVLVRREGGAADHPKMRHLASMRLSGQVLGDVARASIRYVAPLMGRTRKCIVLDLDNTLWGGIVGEDGASGIRLGHVSPGSEFLEFQEYLLSLTRRGMLLAIISKNNEADAMEVIRSHDAMLLRESSFSGIRINWESKADNMLSLADELNLGLDAFVFVDDSEKERSLMRQALPQVLTPEMPRDPALYRETLEGIAELQVLTVTDEDRTRTEQYAGRRRREGLRVAAHTVDDYLRSLGIAAETAIATERTLPRVQQLFQRTNQFNMTNRRYDIGTLSARARGADWRIYATSVRDRFGDHGLVATAVVHTGPDRWDIENVVMSCRVIGYGVEDALLARVATDACNAGVPCLSGEFIGSAKNAPAGDFYARNGFVRQQDVGGAERWQRDLADQVMSAPAWITVSGPNDA